MRRDFAIGISASLAIHAAVWLWGHTPNLPPPIKKVVEEPERRIAMKPIEPDTPEPIDTKADASPLPEFVPVQPELFTPKTDAPFVQPPQLPPPEGPRTVSITIPAGRRGPNEEGGHVFNPELLDKQPTATYQARPTYPFDMRRSGITGQVVVGFVVDASGNVQGAYVVSSSQREFESAALQAVSKWKFRPGKKDGRFVASRMQVPVVFSISEEPE